MDDISSRFEAGALGRQRSGWPSAKIGIVAASAAILIGGIILAVAARGPKLRDIRLEPPLVVVTTAKPAGQTERAFTGVVSARVVSDLGFRVPGKVIERLVDVGMSVRSGQSMMRIDGTDFALAIAAQNQVVAAARARSEQASAMRFTRDQPQAPLC